MQSAAAAAAAAGVAGEVGHCWRAVDPVQEVGAVGEGACLRPVGVEVVVPQRSRTQGCSLPQGTGCREGR